MALVGPRPLPTGLAAALPPAQRERRSSVPPGLTGLWQVRGRSEFDLRQMQRYDGLYVARRGPAWTCGFSP
jgi:lipopolysaccharide/colanic/teichoic acid biosynthesis glycosyltransferase